MFQRISKQSLQAMVDVEPLNEALTAFWKEILENDNARPYHLYRNYAGLVFFTFYLF